MPERSGNIGPEETGRELKYLETVNGVLDRLIEANESLNVNYKQEMIKNRKMLFAENRIIKEFDDFLDISVRNNIVLESEFKYQHGSLTLSHLKRMKVSPYFGKIVFTEDGADEQEEVYVGPHSLMDETRLSFYVYDWRAPISSMFYDYGCGPAAFEAPGGVISGEIINKRQYKITNGRVEYMFDSDLTIDDEILKYELSKPSAAELKPVINSIQRNQNRAIRYDAPQNLLVFGIAGSGKTTVGLHRLSYLLYKHRGHIHSGEIRIFSNNNIFISYIKNIIPELGEEQIPMLDFNDLIDSLIRTQIQYRDMYEQIEYLSGGGAEREARGRGIAVKYSSGFLDFVAKQIRSYAVKFTDVVFMGHKIIEAGELTELYKDRTKTSDIRLKTERITDYAGQKIDEFIAGHKQELIKIYNERAGDNITDLDFTGVLDSYKQKTVNKINAAADPDPVALYKQILKQYCAKDPEISAYTSDALDAAAENGKRGPAHFEDVLMILYIEIIKGSVKKDTAVKHILIDEAQDLNILQHRVIRAAYPESRFTVLADVNQAMYPLINVADKAELTRAYASGDLEPAVITLNKSYRQVYELGRFASQILGIFSEDDYFKRHGGEPVMIKTDDCIGEIVKIIGKIRERGYLSIGILTEHRHEAVSLHKKLSKKTHVELITDADKAFTPGTVIIPAAYAKGLEFDACVIPGYGALVKKQSRRVLYLMCTRALHMLYLIDDISNCK